MTVGLSYDWCDGHPVGKNERFNVGMWVGGPLFGEHVGLLVGCCVG